MTEKYKCHWCNEDLQNGISYSLECKKCKFCCMSFDKYGHIDKYIFRLFENGKDYQIYQNTYGKAHICIRDKYGNYFQPLMNADMKLEFKDGIPQVYKMFEKFMTYLTFK